VRRLLTRRSHNWSRHSRCRLRARIAPTPLQLPGSKVTIRSRGSPRWRRLLIRGSVREFGAPVSGCCSARWPVLVRAVGCLAPQPSPLVPQSALLLRSHSRQLPPNQLPGPRGRFEDRPRSVSRFVGYRSALSSRFRASVSIRLARSLRSQPRSPSTTARQPPPRRTRTTQASPRCRAVDGAGYSKPQQRELVSGCAAHGPRFLPQLTRPTLDRSSPSRREAGIRSVVWFPKCLILPGAANAARLPRRLARSSTTSAASAACWHTA
jgi:hypothetical protein